jgi:hypothetical protein
MQRREFERGNNADERSLRACKVECLGKPGSRARTEVCAVKIRKAVGDEDSRKHEEKSTQKVGMLFQRRVGGLLIVTRNGSYSIA